MEKLLKEWASNNLISDDQVQKITTYEKSKQSNSWVLYGFLILGAVVIGIGVISVIATNWRDIPNYTKLIFDFILLLALAAGTYRAKEKKKEILFEVLLVLYMLFCLASIGLISQIYHTGGKLYQALFLWSTITIGVAMSSKKIFVPFLWAAGFFSALLFIALLSPSLHEIVNKNRLAVFMGVPLLSAWLAIICRRFAGDVSQTQAFRLWAVIGGLIALIVAESRIWYFHRADFNIIAYLPGFAFAALSVLGVLLSTEYKKAQKTLLLIVLGFYLLPFHFPIFGIRSSFLYASSSLAVLMSMALFLASIKMRRLFHVFLVATGIRFLVFYFQAFGGLAKTGFGLIISGLIIMSFVVIWNKYHKKIATWAEGLIQ